jgi:pimeloyl-ACP methyl ester carboxylesterase
MKTVYALLLLVASCATLQGQTDLTGTTWDGAIHISGIELRIAVTFHAPADTPAATIDIPQQSAMGLPLINVVQKPPRVHFELEAVPGMAYFEGDVHADSIRGIFVQAGQGGTFSLHLRTPGRAAEAREEPVPYRQEEVSFKNGSVTLAGTLTLPPSAGRHPALVMLTGSGKQNRDEELFGFKPFKLIADALTRRGIAVLRYDDRGIGGSSAGPADATTEDFANDALCAVEYLRTRNDIDPMQIGLCGHSEGAVAAPIAADRAHDIAFLVLLAGPGVPGDTLILWQMVTLERAAGASEKEITDAVALQHRIYDAIRTGRGWEAVRTSLSEQIGRSMADLPPERRKAFGDSANFVAATTDAKLAAARSAWFAFFISYDPAPTLRRTRCPVLALFGELDMQVPPTLAMKPLESALREGGNKDITVCVLPEANHLFQTAVTGLPPEYGTLKKEFAPGFLETITTWVGNHVSTHQ